LDARYRGGGRNLPRQSCRHQEGFGAMRKITLYRDDSTTQVVFAKVKHFFFTANNTVLTIAQYTNEATGEHRYINWPRERFCWFKDEAGE
jgi:hypothetical protein